VWKALLDVPFGTTVAYSDIATAVGTPAAVRAVGAANGRNPIPIVIPCHRIIGKDGSLTGYGGGLPVKRFLLRLEGATMGHQLTFGERSALPGIRL
jgi:methylated-DNA-[protein]-cysteine S-methyltransferase